MKNLISVIITTYKRDDKYISRAIESVRNQTIENIEIIIVDDNGEGTPYQQMVSELLRDFSNDNRIVYLPNTTNQGAQVSRNNGIEVSKGKFIAFLDDDDEWLPDKLEQQLNVFTSSNDKNLGLVYCDYYVVNQLGNKEVIKKIDVPLYEDKRAFVELLRINYIASTSFPLIKKDCFKKVGLFDTNLKASQDYDMWVRIVKEYSINRVDKPLVKYYKHNDERITSDFRKKELAEKAFLNKHMNHLKEDNKAVSDKYKKIGIYLMKQQKNREAREYFIKSIIKYPVGVRIYKYIIQTFYQSTKFRETNQNGENND